MTAPTVLFICTHNAGRSQLGAHLMDHVAQGRVRVLSGGVAPADRINPAIATTLSELGIDTTDATPRAVTADDLATADVVVTMKPNLDLPVRFAGSTCSGASPTPPNGMPTAPVECATRSRARWKISSGVCARRPARIAARSRRRP